MPIIKSPVSDYTGQTGNVTFVNGEGFTEDANHIAWFVEHGYEIVTADTEPPAYTEPPADTEPPEKPTKGSKGGSKKISTGE